MYLDQLHIREQSVGYGSLGMHGALGYDSGFVIRRQYQHALSAHAPSRLVFDVDGRFDEFHCEVALNDAVSKKGSAADFVVYADDRVVAAASSVRAGDSPRQLQPRISDTQRLTLVTQTTQWAFCHSLWLDPQVSAYSANQSSIKWTDALKRVEVQVPLSQIVADRCIATVASAGYEHLLADLLGSLRAQGLSDETLVAVFNVDDDAACARIIKKYGAYGIPCGPLARRNQTIKSALYSVASLVDAREYICLDSDML